MWELLTSGGDIHMWELLMCGGDIHMWELLMCGGDIHVWELLTCGGDIHVWLTDGFSVTFFGRWWGAVHIHISDVQLPYTVINMWGINMWWGH